MENLVSKDELKIDAQSACHIFKQVIQRVLWSVIVECLASEWIILQNVYINSKMIKKDHSPILIKNIYQESKQLKGGESLEIISAITGTWNDKCHIRPSHMWQFAALVEGPTSDRSPSRSHSRETFT